MPTPRVLGPSGLRARPLPSAVLARSALRADAGGEHGGGGSGGSGGGLITLARPLVEGVARRDRDLGSQVRRALSSVALNVAEGFGSAAGR